MIHFEPETRTFNLLLRSSFYAFQVDDAGRLVHLGWGPRPDDAGVSDRLKGDGARGRLPAVLSFVTQYRPDEVLTYGDVVSYQETLKVAFPKPGGPLAPGEALHVPIRDLRLRYVRHDIVDDAQPGLAPMHGLSTRSVTPRQTLRVYLEDPTQPFTVILCYRLAPEHDIIERWCELENRGDASVTVETCYSAALHLPVGTDELTSVSGGWAAEFETQRQLLTQGSFQLESRSIQTGHQANPFFMLNRARQAWEDGGVVYFGALAYSGSWRMLFERLPTQQVRVHAGVNPFDFELVLAPGERHVTPAVVCGVCNEGWGGASRRLHAFTRDYVLPAPPGASPARPVLYNSWEATYFAIDLDHQMELARRAAAVGVELFCLDDGWFGDRRSDRAGLGDWYPDPHIFPQGLRPLSDEVRRLGMKFGLWVEPEMVNPDSRLYREHPDWVLHWPGRDRTEARNQLTLDFGRPEVVAHIYRQLDTLIRETGVDFLKWDLNRYVMEPGSHAGKGVWHAHVAAVYRLIDDLRRVYPRLEIQSCSGGGGRVDLGVLARADQVWVSDNTDAIDRLRIQEGFSLAYPARTMEAWVTHEQNHVTGRVTPLSLRFDVAMRGVLGIGTNLDVLGNEELTEYARAISFYKRIRHVVQDGDLYRLQRLEETGESIIAYVLPDGSEAVYSYALRDFRPGVFRPPAPLRGLISAAEYTLIDRQQHEIGRATGYELMTLGIAREEAEYAGYSRTLYLARRR